MQPGPASGAGRRGGSSRHGRGVSRRAISASIADVIAVGIVKSQVGAEVKVGSQLSGIVAKLHVNVGDVVKRGDALAELDDAQWRARVTSLEAELAAAEAELAYARSDVSRMERVASYSPAQVENGRRNVQVREAMVGASARKAGRSARRAGVHAHSRAHLGHRGIRLHLRRRNGGGRVLGARPSSPSWI